MSEPDRSLLDNPSTPLSSPAPTGAAVAGSRPEVELLLDAARVRLEGDDAGRIRARIRGGLDWDDLLRLAERNRVLPLLYRSLKAVSPGDVPTEVLDRLGTAFRDNAVRNLRMIGALGELLDVFGAAGIEAVPYKGPTLAVLAYGSLAFREFSDLDLLLRERDLAKARELLMARGFQYGSALTAPQEAAYLRSIGQLPLVSGEGILVELHVGLWPRDYGFPLNPDRLRERLLLVPLAGRNVPTFAVADLILILCAHGERHWWGSLCWICDLAELIRTHREVCWESVLDEARRAHGERLVLLGLALAGELLRAPIPAVVEGRIRVDPAILWLVATVRRWLFREADNSPSASARALFHFRARERWRDGARYCLSRGWSNAFQ